MNLLWTHPRTVAWALTIAYLELLLWVASRMP